MTAVDGKEPMMTHIYLDKIKCHVETADGASAADEIGVFVAAVDRTSSIVIPTPNGDVRVPFPSMEVVVYEFSNSDEGETHHAPGITKPFWGVDGRPNLLENPQDAIFVVGMLELDDGNAGSMRTIVKGELSGTLFSSFALSREDMVAAMIRDMHSALGTKSGIDSHERIGRPQEVVFSREELERLAAGVVSETVAKTLVFRGDGGRYSVTLEARDGTKLIGNNSAAIQIAASGADHRVGNQWVHTLYRMHSNGSIWEYTGTPLSGWQLIDNNPATKQIVAHRDKLYQLHKSGAVWEYTGTPMEWRLLDNNPATKEISATGAWRSGRTQYEHRLYQLHKSGAVWEYAGTPMEWRLLDNNAATKQIAAGGSKLYQLHRNGDAWEYLGAPLKWKPLEPFIPEIRQLTANDVTGIVCALTQDSGLYAWVSDRWKQLDNNFYTRQVVGAGNNTYQLEDGGYIYRYTGTPFDEWKRVDYNPGVQQIACGGGKIYQLDGDGYIWTT